MMTPERNRTFTQVGAGTPMGELLRRYWLPVAGEAEFDAQAVKPIRVLGEDLVLYRDLNGTFGLVERHCPHRRADLSYGFVEQCGLRCNYHGWLFDNDGRTLEQPYEDVANSESHFRDKVRIRSYPLEARYGLIWAYMGPLPAPLIPNFEPFLWENGFAQVVISEIPCNWFQCQENSIDPVHFEWTHQNWSIRQRGKRGPYSARHVRIAFDEFEWGHTYRRLTEGDDEASEAWTIGRVCLWPNALFTGSHFEWRIPVDDENTLSVTWHFSRVPNEREPYVQGRIPTWHGPIRDELTGKLITSHIMNQDFVAWIGQGTVADRGLEHLGASDRGVILLRKRFVEEMDAVTRGEDPKGVLRDAARNTRIDLPIVEKALFVEGQPAAAFGDALNPRGSRTYIHQVGQPESVRRAWEEAMGFEHSEPAGGVLEMLAASAPALQREYV